MPAPKSAPAVVDCKFCGPHAPGKDGCKGYPNYSFEAGHPYHVLANKAFGS